MRSVENYQRLVDLVPSPANGITLCQGNFTLMTDDLPGVIRDFGRQEKIFFVQLADAPNLLGYERKIFERLPGNNTATLDPSALVSLGSQSNSTGTGIWAMPQ